MKLDIEFAEVEELLNKKNLEYPGGRFSLFSQGNGLISVSYWQPAGEIVFESDKGFSCNDDDHEKKAKDFLVKVQENNIDLAITPEYSFPWKILEEVRNDKLRWPKYGKIWCLGMEGISTSALDEFCKKEMKDVSVIVENLRMISFNNFFSCMVYLFRVTDKNDEAENGSEKLACILQLKTMAASDEWGQMEAEGLTCGKRIYIFHYKGCCMLSFICADVLNQKILELFTDDRYDKYKEFLILQPQLNPKPQHASFSAMRYQFLGYSQENVRVISVNWSKGTGVYVKGTGNRIQIEDSFSGFYLNNGKLLDDDRQLILENKKNSLDYISDTGFSIWYSPSGEHCLKAALRQYYCSSKNTTLKYRQPIASNYFEYTEYNDNESGWKEKDACEVCSVDWGWLEDTFGLKSEECCRKICSDKTCSKKTCSLLMIHRFFQILFGENQREALKLKESQVEILFYRMESVSDSILKDRERSRWVNREIQMNHVPALFRKEFEGKKHKWVIEDDYNLIPDETNVSNANGISILFVDVNNEDRIKKRIAAYQRLIKETNRIIVYYMENYGITYYDALYNDKINNPDMVSPYESIV